MMIQYLKQLWLYGSKRVLAWLAGRLVGTQTRLANHLARSLNLAQPHRVNIGHPDRIVILLVGVGGTGSVRRVTA